MSFNRFAGICLATLIMLLGIAVSFAGDNVKVKYNREKARYYYLKGAVSEAQEKLDEAYEYYKKAYKEDPGYTDAAFAYGSTRMLLGEDTFASSSELAKSLSLMRPHLDAYPKDVSSGETYAYYASLNDTLPEAIRVYEVMVKEYPGMSRLYLPLSYYYMNMGETEKAVQALRDYERLEGSRSETLLRKVAYYVSAGDTVGALAEVDAYVAANPGQPDPLIQKSMLYNALGAQDSALSTLEEALIEYPENGIMKFDIALMYQEKGDTARYHQLMNEAFRAESMVYEDRMNVLRGYIQSLPTDSGDYKESDSLFEYASTLYGSDPGFLEIFADYEMAKGDIRSTYEKIKKAFALEPENEKLLGKTISLSILSQVPGEGIKAFENFPDADKKKLPNIMLAYISAAQIAEDYSRAIAGADSLLRQNLSGVVLADSLTEARVEELMESEGPYGMYIASMAFEVAGDLYARMGRETDAVRNYENSLLLNDINNASALNNYAYYIIETLKAAPGTPQFEKAKEMSRKAIEQTEEEPNGNYYDTYAWILFKEGNYKDAREYQEIAIESAGDDINAEFYSHYGDILFMEGKADEAVEQWKKGLELEPDNKTLKKRVENKKIEDEE